ncbi:ATP-binding protein [Thermococcus sp. M39]|uniref:AAA family ATPase n=1 Tax=Thermococcus sp. M39 TaxID=1638262 RepID=UPI00143C29EF|nr:ATP-binding protein [Thermococcus sp. M39]NJE06948.1 ATP-binding protein [Thermococcus sp. M39]
MSIFRTKLGGCAVMNGQSTSGFFPSKPFSDPSKLHGKGHKKAFYDSLELLKRGQDIVILGPRAIGKTSLAKCLGKAYSLDNSTVAVYLNLAGIKDMKNLSKHMKGAIVSLYSRLSGKKTKSIRNVSVIIAPKFPKAPWLEFFRLQLGLSTASDNLMDKLPEDFSQLVLLLPDNALVIFDEVQEMKQRKKFQEGLWRALNEREDVRFIFTGSFSGVVKELLSRGRQARMYYRNPRKVYLWPWDERDVLLYLQNGYIMCRKVYPQKFTVPNDLELAWEASKVYEKLGGIPGIISTYANYRCPPYNYSVEKAIEEAIGDAVEKARAELENIIKSRKSPCTYAKVIASLSQGPTNWSYIAKSTGLGDGSVQEVLEVLSKEFFIVIRQEKGGYRLINAVYETAAKEINIKKFCKD